MVKDLTNAWGTAQTSHEADPVSIVKEFIADYANSLDGVFTVRNFMELHKSDNQVAFKNDLVNRIGDQLEAVVDKHSGALHFDEILTQNLKCDLHDYALELIDLTEADLETVKNGNLSLTAIKSRLLDIIGDVSNGLNQENLHVTTVQNALGIVTDINNAAGEEVLDLSTSIIPAAQMISHVKAAQLENTLEVQPQQAVSPLTN